MKVMIEPKEAVLLEELKPGDVFKLPAPPAWAYLVIGVNEETNTVSAFELTENVLHSFDRSASVIKLSVYLVVEQEI